MGLCSVRIARVGRGDRGSDQRGVQVPAATWYRLRSDHRCGGRGAPAFAATHSPYRQSHRAGHPGSHLGRQRELQSLRNPVGE